MCAFEHKDFIEKLENKIFAFCKEINSIGFEIITDNDLLAFLEHINKLLVTHYHIELEEPENLTEVTNKIVFIGGLIEFFEQALDFFENELETKEFSVEAKYLFFAKQFAVYYEFYVYQFVQLLIQEITLESLDWAEGKIKNHPISKTQEMIQSVSDAKTIEIFLQNTLENHSYEDNIVVLDQKINESQKSVEERLRSIHQIVLSAKEVATLDELKDLEVVKNLQNEYQAVIEIFSSKYSDDSLEELILKRAHLYKHFNFISNQIKDIKKDYINKVRDDLREII